MGTQHTPGPWKWDESWGAIVVDRPDMQKLICPMWTGCDRARMGRDVVDEDLANARLIAAAPDLLEACKIAEGAFGALASVNNLPSGWHRSVVVPLLAAIAKAEGGAE